MSRLRKGTLLTVAAVAIVAILAGVFGLRLLLINSAKGALQTREFQRIDIIGVRIPCSGMFDFGIAAVLWAREGGEAMAGRMCRTLAGSGEWTWHPNEGQARPKW